MKAAQQYNAEADDGRDPDIPVISVHAGQEPAIFTCHFRGWDADFANKRAFKDPYQAKLEAIAAEQAKKAAATSSTTTSSYDTATPAVGGKTYGTPVPGSFTYEQLKDQLPEGVDPSRKEEYLDDATFKQVFNTDRGAFAALAKWKRDDAKKKVGLF